MFVYVCILCWLIFLLNKMDRKKINREFYFVLINVYYKYKCIMILFLS